MGSVGDLPPNEQKADFIESLRGVLSPEALEAIETWAAERMVGGDREALGLSRRLSALEGAMEKALPRVQALENQTPNNAYQRKVDDGHHHYQAIEGMDDQVSQGFGYQLDAAGGIVLTRGSRPNNRRLTIRTIGGLMNVDYVVASDGSGTHTTLAAAVAAAITAASTSGEKTIWLCHSVTEGDIDIGGLGTSATITIASHSRYTVVITATSGNDIFIQNSGGGNINGRLIFRDVGLAPASGKAVLDVNTGSELKVLAFESCNFVSSRYLVRQDGNDSLNSMELRVRHCTGSLAGFYDVAGNSAVLGVDVLEAHNNRLTMTAVWDGGAGNSCPDVTRVRGGVYTIADGITLSNNVNDFHWSDLLIYFAGNEALFTSGASSTTGDNWSWRNILLRATHADSAFLNLGSGAGSPHDNVYVQGIFGYSTVSPTGTFITIDTDILNVHVGDIHAPDWAMLYSGPTGVGDDHGGLRGLGDDDHAQYLLLAGRGGQLITDQVQIQDVNFHVDLGNSYVDHVLAHSPVAYWRLGESSGNFADSSGNSHTAAAHGTITYSQTGALSGDGNKAIGLPGTTADYLSVTDHADLDLGDGPFTLECWFAKDVNGSVMNIFSKGTGAYRVYSHSDNTIRLEREAVAVIVASNVTITDTNWHHLAITKNGATVELYIDGVDRTGSITDSTMVNTGDELRLGLTVSATNRPWDGELDEMALYDSVLTGAQILAHYNEGNGGVTVTPRITFDSGDYFEYNRGSNYFSWVIGSTEIARFTSSGLLLATVAKSSAYTVAASDVLVIADASGGAFTITLPTAVGIDGKVYRVKKIDSSSNTVTVDADGSETIDGGTTATIATQYEAITIVSDGTEWWVL